MNTTRSRPDPDDDQIVAAMAAHPPEKWRELFTKMDALTSADLRVEWHGGNEVRPGVRHMPYPVYGDAVRAIQLALAELNVVVVFDWQTWMADHAYSAERVPRLSVADTARLATAIIRGERFHDGAIAQAIDSGVFTAILDRLRTWHETERG